MPKLSDVAKKANVSISTVSRVISGSSKISEATTLRVKQVMEEMNYHPNAVAKSLAHNFRTKIIGLLFPSDTYAVLHNNFFVDVLVGTSSCAQSHDYYIMNAYEEQENDSSAIEKLVRSRWIDGVILTTVREDDANVKYLESQNVPYAVIGTPHNGSNSLWVDNDNVQAMYQMTCHMIDKGYRNIAFISGSPDFVFNELRMEGYWQALTEHQIQINDAIQKISTPDSTGGYTAMQQLLNNRDDHPIDAVVTTDDSLAYGAMQAMQDAGIHLPISGFNNTQMTEYVHPKLTSVDINAEKLGHNACRLLIAKLENETGTQLPSHHVETQIIERASSQS